MFDQLFGAMGGGGGMSQSSTATSGATGGTSGSGSGAFTVNQSKTAIPQWVWIAAAALAALFIWRTSGKK